ncbi:O-acetyl-ADP-ribose deacetylase [Hymenobacter sp. BT175]|uniref:O-acetyl-ADP-ribose deacetylase n=1 Tax=Hymenobacter translucens TaxID=2886507 RepID=UPI001D0E7CDA|nr:O-acetyl-ADP-ribose deacetylase [Hymenobacter translucens]MCC2547753.1 O-acetyl-ADP-ribose deacetylase [Hymenobacter translucens]
MASTPASWRSEAQPFDRIMLYRGDITRVDTAAIVNAANASILGGGGVDGAIHREGGPAIVEECRRIRLADYPDGLPTGQAVITTGGKLPAGRVIHTVGPIWHGGLLGEPDLLAACYRNSLLLAAENNLDSVSFPGISTGAYGYPKDEAASVAVREVRKFLARHARPQTVVFVTFDEESRQLYEQELSR